MKNSEGSEDRLRGVERRRLRALVARDIATAGQLHADDFQLITPAGEAVTREEYLGGVASGSISYSLWEPSKIEVRRHGDAAVIRYRSELEITVDGELVPRGLYWHTDYYERRGGRWQVVWSQATAIGRAPTQAELERLRGRVRSNIR